MNKIPVIFLFLSLPLYLFDQVTKWWAVWRFPEPMEGYFAISPELKVPVVDGVLWWWRVHNQGVAFGLGNGSTWAPLVFTLVLVVAIVGISYAWRKGFFDTRSLRVAAALLIAGVFGNLTDRMFQGFFLEAHENKSFIERLAKGYVVDFIDIKIPGYEMISPRSGGHWPTFNIADACISCAAMLLFLSAFRKDEKVENNS